MNPFAPMSLWHRTEPQCFIASLPALPGSDRMCPETVTGSHEVGDVGSRTRSAFWRISKLILRDRS
jgi:hypothetical protein